MIIVVKIIITIIIKTTTLTTTIIIIIIFPNKLNQIINVAVHKYINTIWKRCGQKHNAYNIEQLNVTCLLLFRFPVISITYFIVYFLQCDFYGCIQLVL